MRGTLRLGLISAAFLAVPILLQTAAQATEATTGGQIITEFSLPPGSSAQEITAGPDGNMWFTEYPPRIGRITATGDVTEFDVPDAFLLYSITTGPDGSLWFTATRGGAEEYIGRITTAGVVTEFLVPTRAAGLGGIAPGPDGNLWFTEQVVNKIGRVTTNGHFTEFSLPPCQGFLNSCYPQGIVAGPDGNLWVTSLAFNNLWRVTTSGAITELPGSPAAKIVVGPDAKFWTSPSQYEGITAGPDGNVWTTALYGPPWDSQDQFSRIVRTTPRGVTTEFPLPIEKSVAQGIASGSDGNVWFTETTRIGRFNLRVPPGPCIGDSTTLCLNNNRFKVQAAWSVPSQGTSGGGSAVRLTGDTGYFWFFNPDNVELVLKVLDGTALNGCDWVFYGALSDVQYTIVVTDTETGVVTPYANFAGTLASVADTSAFRQPVASTESDSPSSAQAIESPSIAVPKLAAATACTPDPTTLCANHSRFQVTVDWQVSEEGRSGHGTAVPITGDTGYFWFFNSTNVELVLKVLDGQEVNGHFWVFYGALSNVQYTITVTDTRTLAVKTYTNLSGTLASVADTSAF